MAPIERRHKIQGSENGKQQNYVIKQESKGRPQRRSSFVFVPTITTAQAPVNYRQHVIEYCTLTLSHACNCANENCQVEHCSSMKRVWTHLCSCQKPLNNCHICKNFQTLASYHTRGCKNTSCNVVFCSAVRKRRYKTC